MLKTDFENKMMPHDVDTKDVVTIDGKQITRTQARELKVQLSKQLSSVTDQQESRRLADRISAIDRALRCE